jgi:hypothetical protein
MYKFIITSIIRMMIMGLGRPRIGRARFWSVLAYANAWCATTSAHQRAAVYIIDLVLINQQSVGKKSFHLMDTVNANKRWTTIF